MPWNCNGRGGRWRRRLAAKSKMKTAPPSTGEIKNENRARNFWARQREPPSTRRSRYVENQSATGSFEELLVLQWWLALIVDQVEKVRKG